MEIYFYINAAVAIIATALTMISKNAVHALLYFIVSLLAIAVSMYLLGAPFVAALEVIIYAGAIMVLFVFVVMLLNVKPETSQKLSGETKWRSYVGAIFLFVLLIVELVIVFVQTSFQEVSVVVVSTQEVAKSLFTTYTLVIELVSFLLLAGLIGAYHIGKKRD